VIVGALELGGSHVAAAAVDVITRRVDRPVRLEIAPDGTREELLGAIRAAARALAGLGRVGVAIPGPFDYERGVCTIRGVGKLESLYGVDLRHELAAELALEGSAIGFLNDGEAFLLGEAVAGAARGHERAIGLTLGTGLGSAFLAGGELVRDGVHVPPGGELHVVPFRGRPVEDFISGRGIAVRIGDGATAAEIAARADAGDAHAAAALAGFGADLAEFLAPWLASFTPTCVVVGGQVARAWPHFSAALPASAAPAGRLEEAALIGAARWGYRNAASAG
jgi:glucokinase